VTSNFNNRKKQHQKKRPESKLRFSVLLKTRFVTIAAAFENEKIIDNIDNPQCLNTQRNSRYNKMCFKVKK